MAAGSGSRFGEKKQFKLLKGKALYFYSLNKLIYLPLLYKYYRALNNTFLKVILFIGQRIIELDSVKFIRYHLVIKKCQ